MNVNMENQMNITVRNPDGFEANNYLQSTHILCVVGPEMAVEFRDYS